MKCISLNENLLTLVARSWVNLVLAWFVLLASGCAVRRTTKVAAPLAPTQALEASAEDLAGRINSSSEKIQTLTATVDFEPTAGSVYSGVIKEYHDVKGFILVKKPALIRVIGQAPVIRTNIFDMVSDGVDFQLSIPPKHKFIVGKTAFTRPAKNALENLRPQHILDALLVPPIARTGEKFSYEEAEDTGRRYYVLTVFQQSETGAMFPKRKVWFDRSNLDIARLQIYGPQGSYIEDVRYSNYQDFGGIHYPSIIQITRPVDDYQLAITLQKATFNQGLSPEKFQLKKPDSAQLVELSRAAKPSAQTELSAAAGLPPQPNLTTAQSEEGYGK